MFFLFFAAAASEGEAGSSKYRKNKYSITRVIPNEILSEGNEMVHVEVTPDPLGVPYCKFGEIIVAGIHSGGNMIKCRAPQLPPGPVKLRVSFDKLKWSSSVTIKSVSGTSYTTWILMLVVLGTCIAVGLRLRKLLCPRRRKRTAVKRRTRRTATDKSKNEKTAVHNRKANVEL